MAEKKYVIDNPALMAEWDWGKNASFDPSKLTLGSTIKVWWVCKNKHEWQAIIGNRSKGHKCPFCTGLYVIVGENDLKTLNPLVAQEWLYEKNGDLRPEHFKPNSGKKVWWRCCRGHEWQAKITHRNNGHGCPFCKSERNTSFPEYAIQYYLQEYGYEVLHTYKKLGFELDIYIPSLKTAIEYDGWYWHSNKVEQDLEKNFKCSENGVKLYRIREELPSLNGYSIDLTVRKDQKNLQDILVTLLKMITGVLVDVNLERDALAIENLRIHEEKANSLTTENYHFIQEWNYEKNGELTPNSFSRGSNKKVWWRCELGHEWIASISNRAAGHGCPYCRGRKVFIGYNDLITTHPLLAQEWNLEKNDQLRPESFSLGSNKKVWWKCKEGHEWQALVSNRVLGRNCPYCSNRKILSGFNDLQTSNPSLSLEWNYEKNNGIRPSEVFAHDRKKVWWKCKEGHEWQASIAHRSNGRGCPYCSNNKVLTGYNDLLTKNPILAEEWDYNKNGNLHPENVAPNSNKRIWWKCKEGHEWQATINSRNRGNGCPYCSGRKKK